MEWSFYYADMYKKTANLGFTIIELMIVISIVAVLLGLAVPSFKDTIERSAVNKHVNTFISSLRYARSEAIKAGAPVVMCRSLNAEAASPVCDPSSGSGSATGGWASGWLVFVNRDLDGSNNYNPTAGDTLLRVQGVFNDSGGILAGSTINKFIFRPTGLMSSGSGSFTFNSLSLTGARQKLICVSRQGRARILVDSFAACNTNDS